MAKSALPSNVLEALRHLTLEEVEQRLIDLDAERASLSLLRRSLAARERARRRSSERSVTGGKADD